MRSLLLLGTAILAFGGGFILGGFSRDKAVELDERAAEMVRRSLRAVEVLTGKPTSFKTVKVSKKAETVEGVVLIGDQKATLRVSLPWASNLTFSLDGKDYKTQTIVDSSLWVTAANTAENQPEKWVGGFNFARRHVGAGYKPYYSLPSS